MEAGNRFNAERSPVYSANEVHIEQAGKNSYLRVDSYEHGDVIVSRKSTQLASVSEGAGTSYVNEFVGKYQAGQAVIAGTPHNVSQLGPGVVGSPLSGDMILEVPVQHLAVPPAISNAATDSGILIRDPAGHVYNDLPGGPTPVAFSLDAPVQRGVAVSAGIVTAPGDFIAAGSD